MIALSTLVSLVFNGLMFAMLYFLFASGLSLVFGLMGVINFAHGALYLVGAYVALVLYQQTFGSGLFFVALLLAPLAVMLLSMLLEYTTLRPLYGSSPIYQLLLTFGWALVIDNVVVFIWGPNPLQFPVPPILNGSTEAIGVVFPHYRIFVIVVGVVVAALLYLFLERSRYGLIVRAGMVNRKMVEANGVNVDRAFTLMFGIGGLLAGFAGVIAAPVFGAFPAMGQEILILGFVVVVVGGIGSFMGAMLGAVLIALTRTFGNFFIPDLSQFILFLLMVTILLLRPGGLFGKPGRGEHT